MKSIFAFLLAFGLAFAANPPACPNYPYRDFTWASDYSAPVRPADTLLDNCLHIGLNDNGLCSVVDDARLSSEQKKQLILDGLVKNSGSPLFNESDSWNGKLAFTKYAPDGTSVGSSTYIKYAWARIVSLSPSVIEGSENKTYINATGLLRMAKGSSFVVPRQQFGADCRTDYAVCGYGYALSAYDNGAQLAQQNETVASYSVQNFTHGARNNFTASLSVNSEYMIHHYHLVRHCYGRGRNVFCITTCDYYATEDRRDSLRVSDAKTAYYYNFNASEDAFVDSHKDNLTDAWLLVASNTNYSNAMFKLDNSSLKLQGRQYQLTYDLAPYNVITPLALPSTSTLTAKGMSILSNENVTLSNMPATLYGSKIHFLAPSPDLNCTIEINSHFTKQVYPNACRYNATQQPMINLTIVNATNVSFVASAYFYDNATGQSLSGKNLTFYYANQTRSTITDFSGSAGLIFSRSRGASLVSAAFITDFETKSARAYAVIPAQAPDILQSLSYIFALAIALWLAYLFLKRWLS